MAGAFEVEDVLGAGTVEEGVAGAFEVEDALGAGTVEEGVAGAIEVEVLGIGAIEIDVIGVTAGDKDGDEGMKDEVLGVGADLVGVEATGEDGGEDSVPVIEGADVTGVLGVAPVYVTFLTTP